MDGSITDITECDSLQWLGTTYYTTGNYEKTLLTTLGCDSIVHLNLELGYTPTPTEIYPLDPNNTAPHWVITATEFQITSYDFHLWDTNPHCYWDSVTWEFAEPIDWVLEPFGNKNQSCKLYVLNPTEDTVWLEAHVHNRCAPQEGVVQRYWLVCSFYGIEENGLSSGTFDVIPNPNNGQMMLNFEQMDGRVEVKVYDMRGTLIDHIQTENTANKHSITYNLNARASGIYCFVATGRNGTVAKKVIVTH